MRVIVELIKFILKIIVVGFVVFVVFWLYYGEIFWFLFLIFEEVFFFVLKFILWMGLSGVGVLLLFVGFDYLYQRFDYEKNIKMLKQDIKDEYKKFEGDLIIKFKIK